MNNKYVIIAHLSAKESVYCSTSGKKLEGWILCGNKKDLFVKNELILAKLKVRRAG